MNQPQKIKHVVFSMAVFLVIGVLSSCSSTSGSNTTAIPTASDSAAPGPKVKGKDIFSDLKDLNYTPSAQGEYKIGPNDLLLLDVFRVAELSRQVRVSETGTISLPLIGTMKVAGLSQQQLEKQLAAKLSKSYLQNPQVSVSIKEFTSKTVTVGGSVRTPGAFPMTGSVTLSQGVALAGGLVPLADPQKVVLFRPNKNGTFKAYNVDLDAIRNGKMRDPYLNGKDQIIVHQSGSRLWLGRVTGVMRGLISPFAL